MSDNARGTLQVVAEHLAAAVQPLDRAFRDETTFRQFMWRLGWEAHGLPPTYGAVADAALAAVEAAQALATGAEVNEILAVVEAVGDVYRALQALVTAPPGVDAVAFLDEIARGLFELLLVEYLRAELPTLATLLELVGVVGFEDVPQSSGRPGFVRTRFEWARIPVVLTDPTSIPTVVVRWATVAFDFRKTAELLSELADALGLPSSVDRVAAPLATAVQSQASGTPARPIQYGFTVPFFDVPLPDDYENVGVQVTELPAEGFALPGLFIAPRVPDGIAASYALTANWTFNLRAGTDLARQLGIVLRPGELLIRYPFAPSQPLPAAGFGFALVFAPEAPKLLLGAPDTARVEVSVTEIGVQVNDMSGQPEFILSAVARGMVLALAPGEGDSFLQDLLGDVEKRIEFPLGIEWSSTRGIHFHGGAGLEVELSSHIELGPIVVEAVQVRLFTPPEPGPRVRVQLSANITGHLGPLLVTVRGIGIKADLLFEDGNAGPFDIGVGFNSPTSLGLAVHAAGITGGGFLGHPAPDRYEGLLNLKAGQVDVGAVGLLQTGLAGDPGYSLLIVLHATFPAIQVGFGFALTGVGGLIGLNRSVDVDALRNRLAAGTAGRILAPQDPIANAPALLADLQAVFPVTAGVHVIGPTAQLFWADLVHFDVGVFIELPGPTRVVVLGSAHAEIVRDGRSYLTLRVDILGEIDIPAKKVSFDAALIDSHLLGTLDLTGGAAFRLSLGAQPYSVLTLGGFHPAYNPEPLTFPASLTRIAMVHGSRGDELYLRFEGYFAITSNTLQFGAAVEALLQSGGFVIHGMLAFDALIQFVPFHFQFDIRAAVNVSYGSHRLAGLTLTGALSGPGPVVLRAKVCIELLFFDICFSHTFQLGPSTPPPLPPAPDLMTALLIELADPARLRGGGTDPYVQLREGDPAATLPVVIPTGTLTWQQNTAPLQLVLDRVAGTPLAAPVEVRATAVNSSPVSDWFAPGQFINLNHDQALTRPGYELMYNGLLLADGNPIDGPSAVQPVTITEIRLPRRTPPRQIIDVTAFPPLLVGQRPPPPTPAIRVRTESWTLTAPGESMPDLNGAQARRLADLNPAAQAVPAIDQLPTLVF